MPATETVEALRRLGFEADLAPGLTLPDGTQTTVIWVRIGDKAITLEPEALEGITSEAK